MSKVRKYILLVCILVLFLCNFTVFLYYITHNTLATEPLSLSFVLIGLAVLVGCYSILFEKKKLQPITYLSIVSVTATFTAIFITSVIWANSILYLVAAIISGIALILGIKHKTVGVEK